MLRREASVLRSSPESLPAAQGPEQETPGGKNANNPNIKITGESMSAGRNRVIDQVIAWARANNIPVNVVE
jgi:hypothetical protein